MAGALEGIRILDTTQHFAGPLATMTLADQGADVIKVEVPGAGDLLRSIGAARGGVSATFHGSNRNKRSIVLDLRSERGRGLLLRLVRTADVFVQGYRPGVAERLGIGETELRAEQPELVYVSLCAWGEQGPWSQRPGFDSLIQSASGFATAQAGAAGEPQLVQGAVCDKLSGLTLSQAITAALLARERGAGGQHVHMAMLDAAIAFQWPDVMQHRALIGDEGATKSAWPSILPCKDGHVMVTCISDENYQAVCRALPAPELAKDPRFEKVRERSRRLGEMSGVFAQYTRDSAIGPLCDRFVEHDVPHARVSALDDLETHEQLAANGGFLVIEHAQSGRVRAARPAVRFESTPSSVRSGAPALGEHTDTLLGELGVPPEELARLRADGVIE